MSKLEKYDRVVVVSLAEAFGELAVALKHAVRALGKECRTDIEIDPRADEVMIVLGAHTSMERCRTFQSQTIIYNFEQLTVEGESAVIGQEYVAFLRGFEVWDYARSNVDWLKKQNGVNALYVPVGWSPAFDRPRLREACKSNDKPIDVLFYGGLSERRRKLLSELQKAGLAVRTARAFSNRLETLQSHSKLILNMHYYENGQILETPRLATLAANAIPFVSEVGQHDEVPANLNSPTLFAPFSDLVEKIKSLINDMETTQSAADQAAKAFRNWPWHQLIDRAISRASSRKQSPATQAPKPGAAVPRALNIGSGKDFKSDMLNADIQAILKTDIQIDLSDPALINKTYPSKRFGDVELVPGLFDRVVARDVLEHIPNLTQAMRNVLDLLAEGGRFEIGVPYDLSYGAWQDPTHVRAFNEMSWQYYTNWHWYLGWLDYRFDLTEHTFILSDLGRKLSVEGMPDDVIHRTPRAVDALELVLRKRRLTKQEIAIGQKQLDGRGARKNG